MNEVTSVTTGEVRMSYVHLFKPYAYQPGQEEKYQRFIFRVQGSGGDQKGKGAVDGGGVKHHGQAQLLGVGDDPGFIAIDGAFELFEGKHSLTKGFDHRNAADMFHRLVGHIHQGVLLFGHLGAHAGAGHKHHAGKVRGDAQHFLQSAPDVPEGHQGHEGAQRREKPGSVCEIFVSAGIGHQSGQARLFFQGIRSPLSSLL